MYERSLSCLSLLVLMTAFGTGCTCSAESAAATQTPTDGAPASSTTQIPHERIVAFSGFDRDDVPNLSLHVLSAPSLQVVKRTDMDLDTMVTLERIGESGYFLGRADNTSPGVFTLDSENRMRKVSDTTVPDAAFGGPEPPLRVTLSDDKVTMSRNGVEHSVPLLFKNRETARAYWICNRGRAVIVKDGTTALYLIKDVANPVKEKLRGLSDGQLAVDPEAPVFFVLPSGSTSYGGGTYASSDPRLKPDNPTCLAGGNIVKVDAVTGSVSEEFADADPNGIAQIFTFVHGVLLYSDYDGPAKVIDPTSGAVRAKIRLRERGDLLRASFSYADRAYAVVGDDVVDVFTGKVVARLPGFYPICEVAPSPDGRYLIFSALGRHDSVSPIVMRCFDMELRRVVAETALSDVGSQWRQATGADVARSLVGVKQIFFGSDGLVLIFAGSMVVYMDHMHTYADAGDEAPTPPPAEPAAVAVLRGTLTFADRYASDVGIGGDTRMVFLVEDATIDGVTSPPVLLTATYRTSVIRGADGATLSLTNLAVGQGVEVQLRSLDMGVRPVDAIASRIAIW